MGAHTDSPCLKLKPMSARNAHGFVQAGVETYVAPPFHTDYCTHNNTAFPFCLTPITQIRRRLVVRACFAAVRPREFSLRYTWFDRDLGVSGRVLVDGGDGRVAQRLVQIKRPIYRVPSLAIHLNRLSGAAEVGAWDSVRGSFAQMRRCRSLKL